MKIKFRPLFVPAVIIVCIVFLVILACQAPGETEMRVMKYAQEQGVPYASYPQSLIDLLDRNPETDQFVLNYPFREERVVDMSGYDAKRGVPLFLQWDEQWGYMSYGGDFLGINGSAPMCLAMAGYYISKGDEKFYPHRVAEFAVEQGYHFPVSGRSLITKGGPELGLHVTEISLVEQKIADYLKNGDPIIASMGPGGDFDNFVVLTGYREGMVSLRDPDSRINSEKQWAFEELAGQMRNLWVIQSNN